MTMKLTSLGATGLSVSRICLGMMSYGDPGWRDWVLDSHAARPFVVRAAQAGINFFDTADMYSVGVSEEVTGRLLAEVFDDREDYVLATKVRMPMKPGAGRDAAAPNWTGLSRKHVLAGIDASLRRLGTDYVDLYQIHRWDDLTPVSETMEALHDIVRAGKARYIGASSMHAWQFAKAQHVAERHGWTPFVSMQNHYNLLYREEEREMIPQCIDMGVGIIPWSPLARGTLAGTRTRSGEARTTRAASDDYTPTLYDSAEYDIVERVGQIAQQRGVSPAQVALAWLLHKPGVTAPIVGATKLGHLDDAIAAADVELSADEIARLEEPYRPQPVKGHG